MVALGNHTSSHTIPNGPLKGQGWHWEQNEGMQRDGLPIFREHVLRTAHGTGPGSFSEVVPPPGASLIKRSMAADKNKLDHGCTAKT